GSGQDPLQGLENALLQSMRSIATDAQTRAIFEIATLKVEYVDELLAVKVRYAQSCFDATREIQRSLQEAAVH
ncbi:MAG: TetR family transcriptional regulator, partial [Rhodoferax sp.]|nr:TetR family transcriptional regulator [Rhodoferax sp.]